MRARGLGLALSVAVLLSGCAKHADPTTLLSQPVTTPTFSGPGVIVTFVRTGDFLPEVIHVWVEDMAGTTNVKTLRTYGQGSQFDCTIPGPCLSEYIYWPKFWPLSNDGLITDGTSSATLSPSSDLTLQNFWNWKDHSQAVVANASYVIRVEVGGYSSGIPSEAHAVAVKNGSSGSAIGSIDAGSALKSLRLDWTP